MTRGKDGVSARWSLGVYPYQLILVWGDMDKKMLREWCGKFDVMEVDGRTSEAVPEALADVLSRVGMMTLGVRQRKGGSLGVCVFVGDAMLYSFGGYSHEASHVADFICEQTGVRFGTYKDGEAHAYIAGHVAGKMIKFALARMIEKGGEE